MLDGDRAALVERFNQGFAEAVPHNHALGLRILDFGPGEILIRLPYQAHLVGNPETRVLHGGAITALMDATCGAAVFVRLGAPVPIATLDLRIDYLKQGEPDRDVLCRARCFKVGHNVAFVRADAFHEGADADPIACATGTFILFREGGKTSFVERPRS